MTSHPTDQNAGLKRIVEAGFSPTDDAELRLKKVALTLVPLIIGPAAFVWGTIYFFLGHPLSGSIPMSYSIISALSLAHFFKTKKTQFIQTSQLVLVLALPFLLMWSLGGFAAGSMVMIWAIFAPIAALMFLEKRVALIWFLAYFGLILVSTLLDGYLSQVVSPLPELARNVFYLLNMGCGSAGLYLLVSYSIAEEKRAIQKLNQEMAEREHVQLALREAKEQSEEINRMLHAVLDAIPQRIFWKNRNLSYLGCNQLFARDAGKSSPQAIVGASDFDLNWRDVAELYREDDKWVMETGQPKLNYEQSRLQTDGATAWLRTSKVPLRNAAGEVFGVLGCYEDITEEKRIAEALVAAKEAADRANAAKSEFLSRMSHELRTPLNAIIGFGQLLETDTDHPLTALQVDNVHEILHAGDHLLELINEVLDLSRIESGRLEVKLEPVNLASSVEACLSQIQPLAAQRGIHVTMSVYPHCVVRADRIRFKQVLLNLLSNAVKYNREGGDIYINCAASGAQRLRISVRDTGTGISAEALLGLFRPFERLVTAYDGIEGTGIGLALSKRLVEAMQGEIGVETKPGEGSTFWIELPLLSLNEAAPVLAAPSSGQGQF